MLLVGDLHINARYYEKILTQLKDTFFQYPDEKNIIFFGDYVYHFAYDRNALLQLYGLFLDLFAQGKNVYILAGNHDRLGNSFVFEEAKKAFDVLGQQGNTETGKYGNISFITKPEIEEIEGEKILFLPFFLPEYQREQTQAPSNEKLKSIYDFATMLQKSESKQEAFSGHINAYLADQISKHPHLTVIHHYYINDTIFPGQRSKFSYKNIALSEQFLDMPDIKLISGHLHQPFSYRNYLCIGSVRSTSSLEINQDKYIFHYDTSKQTVTALALMINPQIAIRSDEIITEQTLSTTMETIHTANQGYFTSPSRKIVFPPAPALKTKNISLILNVDHIDYDKIHDYIDEGLRNSCQDIRLKKDSANMDTLLQDFKVSSDNLNGFSDRKHILQEYIQKKFGTDYPKYEKVLKELKLL